MPIIQIQNVTKHYRAERDGLTALEVAVAVVVLVILVAVTVFYARERQRLAVQAAANANPREHFAITARPAASTFASKENVLVLCQIQNLTSYDIDFNWRGVFLNPPEGLFPAGPGLPGPMPQLFLDLHPNHIDDHGADGMFVPVRIPAKEKVEVRLVISVDRESGDLSGNYTGCLAVYSTSKNSPPVLSDEITITIEAI